MDRITKLRIKNVRAIESMELSFTDQMTVLIGENGAGKSTVIECLELLRKVASSSFMELFYTQHGGLTGLLRKGATSMTLGVEVEDESGELPRIAYELVLAQQGAGAMIFREVLEEGPYEGHSAPHLVLIRGHGLATATVFDPPSGTQTEIALDSQGAAQPLVSSFGALPPQRAIKRLLDVLRGVEVQLRFDTLARWAAVATSQSSTLRGAAMVQPTTRLELLGRNLANAWSVLKNERSEDDVNYTMNLVRMGLGDDVDSINLVADAGGGQVGLALLRKGLSTAIPANALSDGQLAWLAFVAMVRLNEGRSILAVDEPELHMHPYLVNAVVALLQSVRAPVLISTHSDHVLSLLQDPVASVRVCSLVNGRVVAQRIDPVTLERWRSAYNDLGQLRASGAISRVLEPLENP